MVVLTGGIGCGKSIVSQVLRVLGYSVYDCDREARRLMLTDPTLRQQLIDHFGAATYLPDGTLNKPYLAKEIFSNPDRLAEMNALVHPAVARDIVQRQAALKADDPIHATLFVETAIYFESGFSHLIQADNVWCIAAPLELRIARVLARDHTTRAAIQARIDSQMSQEQKMALSDAVLWNDNEHSIIEQLNHLLGKR